MQPHNDQYLSNFQQPQAQPNIVTKDPDSPGFGKGLAVGFTILVLIWTAEVFGEWNSIQNAKKELPQDEKKNSLETQTNISTNKSSEKSKNTNLN